MLVSTFNNYVRTKSIRFYIAARRAPRFTEMRNDGPDQYHVEGSLCRQRSSRRRLSAVSMRIKDEVSRRRNPSIWSWKIISQLRPCLVSLDTTNEVKEQKKNLVSTVQCSLVVRVYRTPRARPLTNRSFLAFLAFGGSETARLSRRHSYQPKASL